MRHFHGSIVLHHHGRVDEYQGSRFCASRANAEREALRRFEGLRAAAAIEGLRTSEPREVMLECEGCWDGNHRAWKFEMKDGYGYVTATTCAEPDCG